MHARTHTRIRASESVLKSPTSHRAFFPAVCFTREANFMKLRHPRGRATKRPPFFAHLSYSNDQCFFAFPSESVTRHDDRRSSFPRLVLSNDRLSPSFAVSTAGIALTTNHLESTSSPSRDFIIPRVLISSIAKRMKRSAPSLINGERAAFASRDRAGTDEHRRERTGDAARVPRSKGAQHRVRIIARPRRGGSGIISISIRPVASASLRMPELARYARRIIFRRTSGDS